MSDTRITESASIGPRPDLPDGTYDVDPEVSQLRFRAKAFALAWVRGTMPVISGSVRIRDGRVSGAGEIAADKVTTGLAPRDWHLRSSHYLGTARHPRIAVSVDDTGLDAGHFPCTVVVPLTFRASTKARCASPSFSMSAEVTAFESAWTSNRGGLKVIGSK